MSETKIVCVIVTYNGAKWIAEALQSLRSSSVPIHPVIVDNASTDATIDVIKAVWPEAHLIELGENLGFGKANNIGIRYALEQKADYVFLLNQDARVELDALQLLLDVATCHPEYGILSPVHYNYIGDEMDPGFATVAIENKKLLADIFQGQVDDVYKVEHPPAAAWLMSRSALKRAGGFDPVFFLYGEDEDLCVRVEKCGFRIGAVVGAKIYHDHSSLNFSAFSVRKKAAFGFGSMVHTFKNKSGNSFLKLVLTGFVRSLVRGYKDHVAWYLAVMKFMFSLKRICQNIRKERAQIEYLYFDIRDGAGSELALQPSDS